MQHLLNLNVFNLHLQLGTSTLAPPPRHLHPSTLTVEAPPQHPTSLSQGKVQVFPLFGREVFQEVLEELGVRVLQASFEADHVIAKVSFCTTSNTEASPKSAPNQSCPQLAMSEGCAVISNDSDFFIFDVELIRLDSLNLEGDTVTCSKFVRSVLSTTVNNKHHPGWQEDLYGL